MAFRGTTSQIQGIAHEPSQSAFLHRPSHGLTSIPTLFNTENQSFVLVVPPLTHTRRCFAINTDHASNCCVHIRRIRGPMKMESSRGRLSL